MQVKPLFDRVLVKRLETAEVVKGGIIIPDMAKEKPMEAEVIAVGPGRVDLQGNLVPMSVKVGDRVLIGKYSGTELKIDNVDYVILNESEIQLVFLNN